jgi:hypothetical protein
VQGVEASAAGSGRVTALWRLPGHPVKKTRRAVPLEGSDVMHDA